MILDSHFIAKSLHLPAPKTAAVTFSEVMTDSRKISKNSLFLALKGDHFDGHDFIKQAIVQGAKGILCHHSFSGHIPEQISTFRVEDTLEAYRTLAKSWRNQFKIPIIAIGGSFGKTTTKELLAALLHGKWNAVLKTEGSQNGYIGIPMTLLKLNETHQAAVIEIGIDDVGAMEKHVELVAPNAALLTGIGPEHLEKLKNIKTVAREEGHLLTWVSKFGGSCAINLDDDWIRKFEILKTGKNIFYSIQSDRPPEKFQKNNETIFGEYQLQASLLQITGTGFEPYSLKIPLPGFHNAKNLLGAAAGARLLGLTPQEMMKGISEFKGAEGRSEIHILSRGIQVICDYYNASPPSTEAALDLLKLMGSNSTHRWACLGDMLELGPEEEIYHRKLAQKIISLSIDRVLLYGIRMKALLDELKNLGFKGQAEHFKSHQELAHTLITQVHLNDIILIKGSRSMKMEEVWKPLQKAYLK